MLIARLCSLILFLLPFLHLFIEALDIEDIFVPNQCDRFGYFDVVSSNFKTYLKSIAKPGDHLLLEYSIVFRNGSVAYKVAKPQQLHHIILESSVLSTL